MTISTGDRVAFCGFPTAGGPDIGDKGRVVEAGNTGSGVRWITGALAGQITSPVDNGDLVVNGSLDGSLSSHFGLPEGDALQVRSSFERRGAVGLLNDLNNAGSLSSFASIAEDAVAMVAQRIRQDPEIAPALAQLDDDEASEFVAVASLQLLRDAFREEEV